MGRRKKFIPKNVVGFIKDNEIDPISFVNAVFNKSTALYITGQLDLAKRLKVTDLVLIDIGSTVCNSYISWKDLFNTLNESTYCFGKEFK